MNTVWDQIYEDYQKGGPAWASLSEGVMPEFRAFIKAHTFPLKSAFDIGFGTGKYLQFLSILGFEISGIDSSDSALAIARSELKNTAKLTVADMFTYQIPENKYDFIFSIATIHHGMKDQITGLIEKIYTSLATGGRIFIDLPNLDTRNEWRTFKTAKEIAPGTFIPQEGPEQGLPHSIFSKQEVEQMFSQYHDLSITENERRRWIVTASK